MFRPTAYALLFTLALLGTTACDSDSPTTPTDPSSPEQFTETFAGTLTVNSSRTHAFAVQRGGEIVSTLVSVSPDIGTIVGFSLGTWNGAVCQIILRNDNAAPGTTVIGTASNTGDFCVNIYDVGQLSQAIDYDIRVVHF